MASIGIGQSMTNRQSPKSIQESVIAIDWALKAFRDQPVPGSRSVGKIGKQHGTRRRAGSGRERGGDQKPNDTHSAVAMTTVLPLVLC